MGFSCVPNMIGTWTDGAQGVYLVLAQWLYGEVDNLSVDQCAGGLPFYPFRRPICHIARLRFIFECSELSLEPLRDGHIRRKQVSDKRERSK